MVLWANPRGDDYACRGDLSMMTRTTRLTATATLVVAALVSGSLPAAAQPENPGQGQGHGRVKDVVIVGFERGASKAQRGNAATSVGATKVEKLSES